MNSEVNKFDLATDLVLNTRYNVFLTGKAGTGKTTFLKGLLKECPKKYVVVAPTGIAAINANGMTMHSLFQLPFHPYLPGDTSLLSGVSRKNMEIIKEIDLLIIDEVSMLRADMLDAIDFRLRTVRGRNEVFGGVQLLLIGDLFQLPPVAVEEEAELLKPVYDSFFFFDSKALKQSDFVTVELDKIFRQDDKEFKDILNSIREGKASRNIIESLNKRYIPDFKPGKDSPYIRLVTHNGQAERINREESDLLTGESTIFKAFVDGEFPESSYPVPYILALKEGSHVMTTRNKSGEYCNGSLGVVTAINNNIIVVKLADGDKVVFIERETWDNIAYIIEEVEEKDAEGKPTGKIMKRIVEECIGSFSQFPLRQAWAITVHKSQGLTFDHAVIDVSRSFVAGQTYVALSRCRSLDGIVLSEKIDWQAIICDRRVKNFYKEEAKRMPDYEKLDAMRIDAYRRVLSDILTLPDIEHELVKICQLAIELDLDPSLTNALLRIHRDFSISCSLFCMDNIKSIIDLINETPAYSQAPAVQNAITAMANQNLSNINELGQKFTQINGLYGLNPVLDGHLDSLKKRMTLYCTLLEYILENGFNLLGVTRLIMNLNPDILNSI